MDTDCNVKGDPKGDSRPTPALCAACRYGHRRSNMIGDLV